MLSKTAFGDAEFDRDLDDAALRNHLGKDAVRRIFDLTSARDGRTPISADGSD
jgi:hypothetical protein